MIHRALQSAFRMRMARRFVVSGRVHGVGAAGSFTTVLRGIDSRCSWEVAANGCPVFLKERTASCVASTTSAAP